jgi:3-oxoadipate enol-lactonase
MQATVNGFRMNFAVEGPEAAAVVVLHHPLATDLTVWDALTAALLPRYRVVRLDARGHGASEVTPAPYDFGMLTADVVGLMDHLKIARAHFLGLSMGGMVGQHLGLAHPQRLASLILSSTSSRIPAEAKPLWVDRVKVAREKGMDSQVDLALQRWLAPATLASKPDVVARMRAYIEATPVEGYAGWCDAIRDVDVTDRLKAIALPTLIVVGAEDPSTPPAAARVVHREIAGSELVEVPGVSHQLHVEDPATFNRYVLAFLDRCQTLRV